jgi:hypothetical protein
VFPEINSEFQFSVPNYRRLLQIACERKNDKNDWKLSRESVVFESQCQLLWLVAIVKPCKIIQRKSECDEKRNKKNYSRLKLNGIEFGFFGNFFFLISRSDTHVALWVTQSNFKDKKLTKKKSSRVWWWLGCQIDAILN